MKITYLRSIYRATLLSFFLLLFQLTGYSQSVGIGTESPNQNAVLELVSSQNNQGLLIPKVTTAQRTATTFVSNLSSEENGLMVFDSDENQFYFWMNNNWQPISSNIELTAGNGISINGTEIENTGDTDNTNEIQELVLSGNTLSLTNSSATVDLAPFSGTNTDNQNLSFLSQQITLSGDPDNTIIDLSNYDSDASDDFSGDFNDLTGVPSDLLDGDNVLNETQVDNFVSNNGFLTSEIDGSVSNETVTSFGIDAGNIRLIEAGVTRNIPLSSIQDGFEANTDNQTAAQVQVNASGDLTSNNVQDALEELQGEIVTAASAAIPDGAITTPKIAANAVTNAKISSIDFSKITGLPANLDTDATDDFSGAFSDLSGIPSGIADGDDVLTETQVDNFVSDNGFLTTEVDGSVSNETVTSFGINGGNIRLIEAGVTRNIPLSSIQDGFEANTDNQTAAQVQVSASGDLTSNNVQDALEELQGEIVTAASAAIPDGAVTTPKIAANAVTTAKIGNNQVTNAKIVSMDYSKLTGIPTTLDTDVTDDFSGVFGDLSGIPSGLADGDDVLTETQVDNFVSDNGFLTTEIDGSTSNETVTSFGINAGNIRLIEAGVARNIPLSLVQDGFEANTDEQQLSLSDTDLTITGGNSVDLSGIDTNTQLSETQVDNFVSNNGFLQSVSTADIDNNAVTAAKIANFTITNSDIAVTAGISGSKLAVNSVTTSQIATNGVGTSEIANGTIVNVDISSSAAISGTKISPNFGSQSVTGGSFNYNSSQTRTLVITPLDFVALNSATGTQYDVYYNGSGSEAILRTTNPDLATNLLMNASVKLPQGARIRRIGVYARNADDKTASLNFIEYGFDGGPKPTPVISIPENLSTTTLFEENLDVEIDNNKSYYQLNVSTAGAADLGPAVSSVIITYTVQTLD